MGELGERPWVAGGVQRRVLESFLAFLDDEGYVIKQRDEADLRLGPSFRSFWIEEYFSEQQTEYR